MAMGVGADWSGDLVASETLNFDLTVDSGPTTGVVQVSIKHNESIGDLARKLANEWNARQPIRDVAAVAEPGTGLTAFFLVGTQEGNAITNMAVTFQGKSREEVTENGVSSQENPQLSVTREENVIVTAG